MMEKLFSAKVVGVNNYMLSVMLFASIGGSIILLLIMLTPIDGQFACYMFLGVILITVVAALFSKEGLGVDNLDEELFVYEDHLEIGRIIFPFAEIEYLKFSFAAFSRMKPSTYQPDPEADYKKHVENGMNNSISFIYKNQSYDYKFFVQSQQHFYQFVQMLEQLYANQIHFLEKNWYGKTFLMQNVTDEQYDVLIKKYQ